MASYIEKVNIPKEELDITLKNDNEKIESDTNNSLNFDVMSGEDIYNGYLLMFDYIMGEKTIIEWHNKEKDIITRSLNALATAASKVITGTNEKLITAFNLTKGDYNDKIVELKKNIDTYNSKIDELNNKIISYNNEVKEANKKQQEEAKENMEEDITNG